MSNETEGRACSSSAYREDQLTHCTRPDGHDGVHIGRVTVFMGAGEELVQWTDTEALNDEEGVDGELPVWYSALPLGKRVRVGYRDERDRLDGELVGCVLDDHEQPSALIVGYQLSGVKRRAMIPFGNIAVMSWDED